MVGQFTGGLAGACSCIAMVEVSALSANLLFNVYHEVCEYV